MCKHCRICFNKTFLSFITILTMGLVSASFISILILSRKNKIDQLSDEIFYFLISGLIISIFILCFGIYASCCGRKCSLITLSILFLIFSLLLIVGGILLYVDADKIVSHCKKIWTDSKYSDTRKTLEEFFECSGFDPKSKNTCYTVIKNFLHKYKIYVSFGMFFLAVLEIIAMSIALANSCCKNEDNYSALYNSFT